MISFYDAFECALHGLVALLFDGLFSWFSLVALLKFVLVSKNNTGKHLMCI
jgi:hypothetical protein